ncbi:hypothetical protein HGRIS_002210 [Hohenbuehelia grisea]|uniref:Peptidase C15, pyroglutamyl peptidase I-like protein n=1 Tax=Hohenbuehelia grisea TaxID=104357 RepID=A0ABR3JKX9_9AGAR
MPTLPVSSDSKEPQTAFRVLLTGFGPFAHFDENPSWLAVKPLHNVVIEPDATAEPIIVNNNTALQQSTPKPQRRSIHISTLQVPVTYEAVLATVPGLHARPPVLPDTGDPLFPPPPAEGYDLMFHIGVAGRGPLRMEHLGHKLGYHMKDATGKLASLVRTSPKDFSRQPEAQAESIAEAMERERLGIEPAEPGGEPISRPNRGFGGPAYENVPDELYTEVDIARLIQDLKRSGIEQIYTSMDAGHYLCDFIYYCSLAEAKRTSHPYEKRRNTHVLFLHCPPVDQPLSTEEVTEAIKRIIVWICQDLEIQDAKLAHDEASGPAAPAGTGPPSTAASAPGTSAPTPGPSVPATPAATAPPSKP